MRPIGGLIVGYTGDKHGRKRALARALLFMAVPTTVMGCLPTYSTVGWLAPLLLALCRLCQGISVGGQLPASLVYTVEPRPVEHWGFYGSLPMVAANTGSLLGNLCGAFLRQAMSEDDLREYGWRIPFLSGIIIAFVGLYLRFYGEEMHPNENVYDHNDSSRNSSPIVAAFGSHNHRALFSSSLTPMLWAGGFYLSFVWMAIFMAELLDPPVENAFWINAAALFLSMTFMLPVAGAISDRLGRTKTMSVAATRGNRFDSRRTHSGCNHCPGETLLGIFRSGSVGTLVEFLWCPDVCLARGTLPRRCAAHFGFVGLRYCARYWGWTESPGCHCFEQAGR